MKTPWEIEMMPRKDKWEVKMTAPTGGNGNYILPIASPDVLGGVRPENKTEDMNLPVGIDTEGKLWVNGEVNVEVDTTLTKPGEPADAAVVGQRLEELRGEIPEIPEIPEMPEIAADDEIIDLLIEEDMLSTVCDINGDILSDENENILLW